MLIRGWLVRISLRGAAVYVVPLSVTVGWLVFVLWQSELGRAIDHWEAALMMVFGGFLGGSSPGGSGAVAFPVLTKLLDVPPSVARTFSLSIQAVGMTSAVAVILLTRRRLEPRAILVGVPAGIAGFLAAILLLGDRETPFLASEISAAYVKVTFTLVLAAMAYIMFVSLRQTDRGADRVPHWNRRVWFGLALCAFLGGGISSLTGTGVNVLVFLFIVVMCGLHPRVGIPTSVVIMAAISIVGLATLGVVDGQLAVGLGPTGEVVSVGGQAVAPLPAERWDLFGLWIAAVPIVVWAAPLGTWMVQRLHEDRLAKFVGTLAAVEVLSTFILLDELHSDPALIAYALLGLLVVLLGVRLLARNRHRILGLPRAERAASRLESPRS